MSIRTTRQDAERRSVPSLQIMPRLEPGRQGQGASLRLFPGRGLRGGLIALLAALAAGAAIFALIDRSHRQPGRASAAAGRHAQGLLPGYAMAHGALAQSSSRLALAGLRSASRSLYRAAAAGAALADRSTAVVQAPPSPHYLSSADLTALSDRTSGYQPPAYLVRTYTTVASHYGIPWRLLAAIEYIQGGYVNATAGASSTAERSLASQVQTAGRVAVNARVLAHAAAAATQPSSELVLDAKRLAADGGTQSSAQAATAFLSGTGVSAQTVLTLAQSIDSSISSSSAPMVRVQAMLNEARLLNGLPYVWGGGHTEPAWVVSAGYDCSGFVSEVLHSAGYLSSPATTQTLPGSAGIVNGPGKYVTIYDRTIATLKVWVKKKKIVTEKKMVNPTTAGVHVTRGRKANSLNAVQITVPKWVGEWKTIKLTKLVPTQDTSNNDEHVIIDVDGQWWESGGSSADGGAGMVHPILNPSKGYLKSFNRILHPQGL